jgi:hypothetical protein
VLLKKIQKAKKIALHHWSPKILDMLRDYYKILQTQVPSIIEGQTEGRAHNEE